jgi:thioesterase domain-containing protein
MAFEVVSLESSGITVMGSQHENINVHGTAFAGSLYCMCTLAVWGLVYSRLPENASLVIANAHIDYLKPVIGDILARGVVVPDEMEKFLAELQSDGKSSIKASADISQVDKQAVQYTAKLYARLD